VERPVKYLPLIQNCLKFKLVIMLFYSVNPRTKSSHFYS
jgi:hypothetical protein